MPHFYTYSIKNIDTGKFYIGSRTSKCMLKHEPEDDLGIQYFSSSTDKELIQAIKDNRVEYHVLQEYDDPKICWRAEQQLIALYWKFFGKDMSYNHSYINCEGDKIFSTAGMKHKPESIEKMRESQKGKPKLKYYWKTPNGEIRIMDKANVKRFHPDWILIDNIEK